MLTSILLVRLLAAIYPTKCTKATHLRRGKVLMKYREILMLESDERIDPHLLVKLDNLLRESNVVLRSDDFEYYCWQRCKELILEKGTSYVLSVETIQEEVLRKVDKQHKYLLVEILRNKLKALSPSNNLIIVDYYLFPDSVKAKDKADFLQTFSDVLDSVIHDIKKVSFVTQPRYNQVLSEEAERLLENLNPQIVIDHTTTDDFHDRFWIVDECKGLFVGTSLNGIGKKYALIDNMRDEDTKEIVEELKMLNLITC